MDIREARNGGVLTVGVAGKLDATTAKPFEDRLLGAIDAGEQRVVLDLARLDYVSSAGLRVFLLAAKRLKGTNGTIVLCSLTDQVKEVFDIAGFLTLFPMYGSHDEALRNL